MTERRFVLHKEEILRHKSAIQRLFKPETAALRIQVFPFKFIIIPSSTDQVPPIRVLFIVPGRVFRQAVDRNLIRRRMKEAYRLNKFELIESIEGSGSKDIGIIYTAREICDFWQIDASFKKLVIKLKSHAE